MNCSASHFVRFSSLWLILTLSSAAQSAAAGAPSYTISRSDLDGSNVVEIVVGDNPMDKIALDTSAGKMYWTAQVLVDDGSEPPYYEARIERANLDGSDREVLVSGLESARGIAVDSAGGKIYWTSGGPPNITRSNLDGTEIEVLVESFGSAMAIALNTGEGLIYWSAIVHRIWRTTFDGASSEEIVYEGNGLFWSISLDPGAGKIYFTRAGAPAAVLRANLDGSEIETLMTGLDRLLALVVDPEEQTMYVADNGASTVWRADLNGNDRQPILNRKVLALALDPQSDQLYFIEQAATVIPAVSLRGVVSLASVLLVLASALLLGRKRNRDSR